MKHRGLWVAVAVGAIVLISLDRASGANPPSHASEAEQPAIVESDASGSTH